MQDQNDEFSTTKTRHETGFKPGHCRGENYGAGCHWSQC